jgi:putative Holliday junction resolvase
MNRPDQKDILMGLDVGTAFVGLALGFISERIATPLAVVPFKEAETRILSEIKERSILQLIVGLPLHEDGRESDMSLKVRKFSRRLLKRADIKIVFVDEYGSSIDAIENQIGLRKRSDGRIDDRAAAEIVRRYFAGEGIVK